MGVKFGFNAQLEYNTSGVGGAGSWETLSNAKDVTLSLETAEADATTRANNGWRATVAGLKDGSVEFEMVWDTGDAGFTAVKDAFMNNTVLGLKVLDGATGEGLVADFNIFQFSRSEPLDGLITVSVSAKIAYSETPPTWQSAT
jgi:predicted secreted protein